MKKVAIVVQRYGSEVNGGAEKYAKDIAEHLKPYYDIEVITTTAKDYDTWMPYYSDGEEIVDGITIHRFSVDMPRSRVKAGIINKGLRLLPIFKNRLEESWIDAQGPYCPKLIDYIKQKKDYYDCFIFVTYLYYPTVKGLPIVKEKAIFVPTAHDEYCIYMHVFETLFKQAERVICLTSEEEDFIKRKFPSKTRRYSIAGTGMDIPKRKDEWNGYRKERLPKNYIIYVGRVEKGKGCDELFEYFERYQRQMQDDTELVVVGKTMMKCPENPKMHFLGFVSDDEKLAAIDGARALIMPSEHESLSLVVLEAMSLGIPVIVNGRSAVLSGHCKKSKTGFEYKSYEEFKNALEELKNLDYEENAKKELQYIKENYSWENTIQKYKAMIESC